MRILKFLAFLTAIIVLITAILVLITEGIKLYRESNERISPFIVVVSSTSGWNRTGLILRTGQSILITANGNVDYNGFDEATGNSNPDGDGVSCDKAYMETMLNQEFDIECLISGVSYGALVGRVGESTPFLIGSSHQFTTNVSGELYLGVNDCCSLTDNSGEFKVTILSP